MKRARERASGVIPTTMETCWGNVCRLQYGRRQRRRSASWSVGRLAAASLRPSPPPLRHLSLPLAFWLARPFSLLPREDIKKPTMESAGDGEEKKGDGTQRFGRK